jgi:hypothetical protein
MLTNISQSATVLKSSDSVSGDFKIFDLPVKGVILQNLTNVSDSL